MGAGSDVYEFGAYRLDARRRVVTREERAVPLARPDSVSEKIETGRFTRWSDLDDLFACCIVIPTLADEMGVLELLRGAFQQVEHRARASTRKDRSVFRFDSTRFIGTLWPIPNNEPAAGISDIRFEVQIRTAFEHAWSVTTHAMA
jgi:hypothetical protein